MAHRSIHRPRLDALLLGCCIVFATGLTPAARAQTPLFSTGEHSAEPIAVTLTGPWQTLARDRQPEPEYRDASLTLDASGEQFALQSRPRGKSRRKTANCRFPPLWLRFDKTAIAGTDLAGHHRRKLVTHCSALHRPSKDPSKVWLEMQAYRTLNLLTARSFRVQPLALTYIDTDRPERPASHPGFLIEHKKELAARLALKPFKEEQVARTALDAKHSALVALFNMLIGNPDFSLARGPAGDDCCHNSVPLMDAQGLVYSVPYDFDNTGLVNPRYATAPANIKIRNVRQRVYRGYCRHNAGLGPAIEQMLAQRAVIETLFAEHPGIRAKEKARISRYLAAFFDDELSPAGQQKLKKSCLG
jgi:hypothetical protein